MLRTYCILSWVILIALALSPLALLTRGDTALVYANPVTLEIGEGQIETLQILLVGAKNIYGIDLQAAFDPDLVEVVDADSKHKGIQMEAGDFLKPDFTVYNLANNKTGTLKYVVTQLNPTPPANGEGVVLSIKLRGKVAGARSKIIIVSVQIADRRGVKQPVTTRGADLFITLPKPASPTPPPTLTLTPPTPTAFTRTMARSRLESTAWPSEAIVQNIPTRSVEENSLNSDQILSYITMGGFSGSVLLFGLSFWVFAARRRKEKAGKEK